MSGDSGGCGDAKVDYGKVLEKAFSIVRKDLRSGNIRLETEGDLRAYLFHACVEVLKRRGHAPPYPVHAEKRAVGKLKADIILGPGEEIAVELKFEPWSRPGGTVFARNPGGHGQSIWDDVKKLRRYTKAGKSAHFLMIEMKRDDEPYDFPDDTRAGIRAEEWVRGDTFAWVHHVE